MNFHNVVGTGSYTTSTTNMYNKYRFHVPSPPRPTLPVPSLLVVVLRPLLPPSPSPAPCCVAATPRAALSTPRLFHSTALVNRSRVPALPRRRRRRRCGGGGAATTGREEDRLAFRT